MSYGDAAEIIRTIAKGGEFILVGGQALNFWVDQYRDAIPELSSGAPYTSKDIDVLGGRDLAAHAAANLNGTPRYNDDPFDSHAAIVTFRDSTGQTREIDFLT